MDNSTNINPLLEINTSFADYLSARTRNSTEHMIDGRMDYSFDGDFAMRNKINTVSGWSRLYKSIVSSEMPSEFKKLFRFADEASSMLHAKLYSAAGRCAERMQVSLPSVMVKAVKDIPEIYSLTGEGFTSCVVVTSDIEEICSEQELNYLIGCELGRIQNSHPPFRFACDNIFSSENGGHPDGRTAELYKQLAPYLESWLRCADFTADRAGIICLDDPAAFPEIYASIRNKAIPDSFGNTSTGLKTEPILEKYDEVRKIPARSLKIGKEVSQDERRIMAGLEFIGCEILYSWRRDLASTSGSHLTNKQGLEIRCELLADCEEKPEP